jgi:MFS family permease
MAATDDAGETTSEPTSTRTLLGDPRLASILLLSGAGILGTQLVPPVLPAIQSGLGISDAQIGLVMTALFLPAMVLTPVVGAVCDIYGRRPVSLASIGGFGVAGVAIYFAPTFEVLLALRVVQGICFAALTPLSVAFIGDFFQGQEGTTAQGIRSSTNGLVIIVAPTVAGVLADIAWNLPFLVYLAAIPAMVYVYYNFPEPEAFESASGGSIGAEMRVWIRGVVESLNDRNLLLLILGGFTLFLVRYSMFTVAPLLATRTIELNASTVGVIFSLMGVVRVIISPQAGRLAAWLPRKTGFVITMSIVGASMVVFAAAVSLWMLVAAAIVYAVGQSLFNPTLNDTVTVAAPADNRAGVVSALQSTKNLANTIGPAIASLLLAFTDFQTVFLAAGGVVVLYVLMLVVWLDPDAY